MPKGTNIKMSLMPKDIINIIIYNPGYLLVWKKLQSLIPFFLQFL